MLLYAKNQKNLMQWFAIKLKKIIWVAFLPKKNWYKIFPQKSFESILRLYATVTLRKKKTRKILCIYVRSCFKKTWKASFGAHFRPHLAQNYKTGFLQLRLLEWMLSLLGIVTWKVLIVNFIKLEKHVGPILAWTRTF